MSVAGLVAAACLSLSGAHITAGDLARAVPGFAPADPAAPIAWSPAPGLTRVFHPFEVTQILRQLDPTAVLPGQDVCFERPVAPLSEKAVLEAMRLTIGKDSPLDLLEISQFPVPEGEVVFPREALNSSSATVWHGFVRYDDNKKFSIWARVRVRVMITRLIAAETLPEGKPIQPSQVKVETIEGSLIPRGVLSAIEQIDGYVPRRTITVNSPIWTDSIDLPKEILKGDRVTVTVHSGLAVLTFAVDAVTSGRRGDLISLKNPQSGKLFRARVEGPKTALLQIGTVNP